MPTITGIDGFEFQEAIITFEGNSHFDFYSVEVREECRCWAPYSFLIGGGEPSIRVPIKNTGEHLVSISGYIADGQIYSDAVELVFEGENPSINTVHKDFRVDGDLYIDGEILTSSLISEGSTVMSDLVASGDVAVTGDLMVSGDATLSGLSVIDDLSVYGDIEASNNLTVAGDSFLHDTFVDDQLTVGNVYITGSATNPQNAITIEDAQLYDVGMYNALWADIIAHYGNQPKEDLLSIPIASGEGNAFYEAPFGKEYDGKPIIFTNVHHTSGAQFGNPQSILSTRTYNVTTTGFHYALFGVAQETGNTLEVCVKY
jgi:cytoskeletal protein CcmA (bactofilin family)